MSPSQFHETCHAKRSDTINGPRPPPLKICKDSHLIKKSVSGSSLSPSPSSSSSSSSPASSTLGPTRPRHPVIIYTHSPKIIHTHPKDFMALVQKLTGLSRSNDVNAAAKQRNPENGVTTAEEEQNRNAGGNNKVGNGGGNDDNESSSVITDENCGGNVGDGQVNSCFVTPPIFDPPANSSYLTNLPVFTPNLVDHFVYANQPFYNYADSVFFPPSMRSSISSSTSSSG
ncbi:VQ motif-containing protein 20-like, partial [Carica papaya]|uniref:VQ motif-containing protein 20-like n=1 Tax=Carica papaya TaxID=3649 RepID=UPI000B8D0F3E